MTIVVGLTGGIASGKSFIVDYLKKIKIPTHESDIVVQNLYLSPSSSFLFYLKTNGFSKVVLKKKINKIKIREEIFNNKAKKRKLEKYIHNEVRINREIFLIKNKNKKIVFLDIPLLFEKKLQSICNYICAVIAPLKTRERRALQRKGMTKKIFKQILKNQTKDKTRRAKSNYIINTSNSKPKTYLQINNIIYDILKKNK